MKAAVAMTCVTLRRALAAAALIAPNVEAQCFEWASGFHSAGTSDPVLAQVVFDDGTGPALYVGGTFKTAGPTVATRIAKYDGTSWSALGTGVGSNSSAYVSALFVYDDGSGPALIAGGRFDVAGGVSAKNVAEWNGSSWSALGADLAYTAYPTLGDVSTFAAFDDGTGMALYAGGYFDWTGSQNAYNIAKWNGVTWSPIGGGGTSNRVRALAVYDHGVGPRLYAAGDFTHIDGLSRPYFARYTGNAWIAVPGVFNTVYSLAVHDDGSGNALYVSGTFSGSNMARWNGATLTSIANVGFSTSMVTFDDGVNGSQLYAAGQPSGFTIHVANVEGQKQGHLFYGLSGAIANPWSPLSSSYLCVKAPSQRTPTQNSNGTNGACDGVMQIDWLDYVATHPGSLGVPFSAGTQVWAQLYFRDPPAPKTTNLSNGLTFFVAP